MLGEYIVENKATVRRAAKQFGVSKSTVHKDVAERLRSVDMGLYKEVSSVLAVNKAQRHIRGGMATKRKYEAQKKLEKPSANKYGGLKFYAALNSSVSAALNSSVSFLQVLPAGTFCGGFPVVYTCL